MHSVPESVTAGACPSANQPFLLSPRFNVLTPRPLRLGLPLRLGFLRLGLDPFGSASIISTRANSSSFTPVPGAMGPIKNVPTAGATTPSVSPARKLGGAGAPSASDAAPAEVASRNSRRLRIQREEDSEGIRGRENVARWLTRLADGVNRSRKYLPSTVYPTARK